MLTCQKDRVHSAMLLTRHLVLQDPHLYTAQLLSHKRSKQRLALLRRQRLALLPVTGHTLRSSGSPAVLPTRHLSYIRKNADTSPQHRQEYLYLDNLFPLPHLAQGVPLHPALAAHLPLPGRTFPLGTGSSIAGGNEAVTTGVQPAERACCPHSRCQHPRDSLLHTDTHAWSSKCHELPTQLASK